MRRVFCKLGTRKSNILSLKERPKTLLIFVSGLACGVLKCASKTGTDAGGQAKSEIKEKDKDAIKKDKDSSKEAKDESGDKADEAVSRPAEAESAAKKRSVIDRNSRSNMNKRGQPANDSARKGHSHAHWVGGHTHVTMSDGTYGHVHQKAEEEKEKEKRKRNKSQVKPCPD